MELFDPEQNEFLKRHIGPNSAETKELLQTIGIGSAEEIVAKTFPADILLDKELQLPPSLSEYRYLEELKQIAAKNQLFKNYIGQGYYGTIVPSVILRNFFENPGWYTSYTPYQAEISQGRLECLLNFQTMISDLTGLPIANAGLLDEGTAAAEAVSLVHHQKNKGSKKRPHFFVDEKIFPQTREVLLTRCEPIGIQLEFGPLSEFNPTEAHSGLLMQYPNSEGAVIDYSEVIHQAKEEGLLVVTVADLLALCLLKSPGELGADIAVGTTQRFGVPLGFGGPHSAYFSTKESFKRQIPGRVIGVSQDRSGQSALRMALQTREQHIRREKATSNICTAQALLANMAGLYAVYHGPQGLKNIALRVHRLTATLNQVLTKAGYEQMNPSFFDTLWIKTEKVKIIRQKAEGAQMNFYYQKDCIGISIDETTSLLDLIKIANLFSEDTNKEAISRLLRKNPNYLPPSLKRESKFLTHPVFQSFHSETRMMRYLRKLVNRDLALDRSMIPLGSCTMKLNAATEMIPLSWPEFSNMHPLAPKKQTAGYTQIIEELSSMLCEITGLSACTLQPNSGAQGEFTGLMMIRAYHRDHGNDHRKVILIPISSHGTNPASAVMAGMKVVVVACDEKGSIDLTDLREKAENHRENLAGLMVTYPSTYGVFELGIHEMAEIIHENGGLVYLDGANMNAQVGYSNPGKIGADVCHLNLHKTFAIPHGGGGPGAGPVCANEKLSPYLPRNIWEEKDKGIHAVSSAAYGSASILLVSYGYIRLLGTRGLKQATLYAILNANYMKSRLESHYKVLYSGPNNTCAHEFIIDLREFRKSGIEAEDIAKRLIDYGFHAPTLSFPVPGTLMVEPTESEDKKELDRFCESMIAIKKEIIAIQAGTMDSEDNPIKNAPHTQKVLWEEEWVHPYTRKEAAFPLTFIEENKYWPPVERVNNSLGDRNLICTCEPVSAYV